MLSLVPLNINWVLILRFLAAGVPSVYHLMKFSLSSRSLPLVHEIPFAYSRVSLYLMLFVEKDTVVDPLTLL